MPFGNVISRFNGLNHRLAQWRYALAAAVGCIVVAASLASNLGVCIAQGRILSSEDYFKAAIDVVIHDPVDGVSRKFPDSSSIRPFDLSGIQTRTNSWATFRSVARLLRQIRVMVVRR